MADQPVARLRLDTRSWGPAPCPKCGAENEDAILTSSASIVCPECGADLPGLEELTKTVVSASAIGKGETFKQERWVIEYGGQDPRQEATVAYDNRGEAVQAAIDFIKRQAQEELERFEWEPDDPAPEDLKQILGHIEQGRTVDAIVEWLEYQGDYNPDETIALGPSGSVSANPSEFSG